MNPKRRRLPRLNCVWLISLLALSGASQMLKTATLVITSNPAGATIYIGGKAVAKTDATLVVTPGDYMVEIKNGSNINCSPPKFSLKAGERKVIACPEH